MDWNDEHTLLGNRYADLSLGAIFAVAFPLSRWILTTAVFKPTGLLLVPSPKKTEDSDDVYQQKLAKWRESSWKLTVYVVFTTISFLVSYREPWFTDREYFWKGCTGVPCQTPVSKGMLLFYCVEIGFYVQAIPFLFLEETKRKDRLESFTHHVATLGLLVYSYAANFTNVGIMTLLLHDCNDIFLELAKLLRYMKAQTQCTVAFIVFALSWVVTRMVLFPMICMRAALVDSLAHAKKVNANPEPHYTIFFILFMVIFLLNTYWTYLIGVVVMKNLRGSDVSDVREDDDTDDD